TERCGQPLAQALDLTAALPHRLPHLTQAVLQKLVARARTNGSLDDSIDIAQVIRSSSKAYTEMLARLGEADDASAAFKQFLQALGGEIATSVESAISESTTVIADLRARESEMLHRIGDLERRVVQSDYDSLTHALTRRGFIARAKR